MQHNKEFASELRARVPDPCERLRLRANEPVRMRVYAGQTCWLLTPEFLLPPSHAALYEPLLFKGYIHPLELGLTPEGLAEIHDTIDRSFYAVVAEETLSPVLHRISAT